MFRLLFIALLCFTSLSVFAQTGQKAFEFVNVPNNARLAALGGVNVSLADRDVNSFYANPSLVSDTLSGMASASYQLYVADIGQATFSYAHKFKRAGTFAFGVQHLNYGTIKSYDATGQETGDFKSGETALVVSKSHQVNAFRFGVNMKMVFSNIAGYRASAMLFDVGGVFVHPKQDLKVGLVLKNAGFLLSEYSQTSSTKLPADVQAGITFKPAHMPLRFSITAYNLMQSKVSYSSPPDVEAPSVGDKILRRFSFGTEILIHKNVNLLAGYNYRIHRELKLANGGGGAGISLGFLARIKSTEFIFSRGGYVSGKGGYTFTLSVNTQKLLYRH